MYDSLYDCDNGELAPYIEPDCPDNYDEEYARVGQSGFVRDDYYPILMASLNVAKTWTDGVASGQIILQNEVLGSFDGGSPKTVAGFGRTKEKDTGSDFVLTIKDRFYKENFPFYKSLTGATRWHAIYKTSSQVHVSGTTVSARKQNPITENVDDLVMWQVQLRWFEKDTPAPHDMPAGVFKAA